MHRSSSRMSFIVVLAACELFACNAQPTASTEATTTPAASSNAASNSVQVFIDPKTGESRQPTAEELSRIAQEEKARIDAGKITRHEKVNPNGTIEVELSPADEKPIEACVAANGQVKVDHNCRDTSQDVAK